MKSILWLLSLSITLALAGCSLPHEEGAASATRTAAPAAAEPTATAKPTEPLATPPTTATRPPRNPIARTLPAPTATPVPTIAAGEPVRLAVPAIGVDAAIEAVGQDSAGNMANPEEVNNVAWYQLGARPGAGGGYSAVIAGHLDDYLQQPAVFWRLGELRPGDVVTVTDDMGNVHEFEVTGMETYRFDQAPIAKIFGSDGSVLLNLITCQGEWDREAQNYNERLVVYTRLKS